MIGYIIALALAITSNILQNRGGKLSTDKKNILNTP